MTDEELTQRDEVNRQKGFEEGLVKGIEQGTLHAKRDSARRLKAMGMEWGAIYRATDIIPDEIFDL